VEWERDSAGLRNAKAGSRKAGTLSQLTLDIQFYVPVGVQKPSGTSPSTEYQAAAAIAAMISHGGGCANCLARDSFGTDQ
jgi:hypothetical protein